MKDHVGIGHLTKYDAVMVNRHQAINLEIWFKIHTILRQRPPKPYETLNQFCDNCKIILSCTYYLKEAEMKIAMFGHFKEYIKSLYDFRGRWLKMRDVCMDFEPNHDQSQHFMWWCQFIDLLKFETRPSCLLTFGTARADNLTTCYREKQIDISFLWIWLLTMNFVKVVKVVSGSTASLQSN